MCQSIEAGPEPGEASKINIFVRIVKFFELTLLTIFVKSTIMDV